MARTPRPATPHSAAAAALPGDVRLTNLAAAALLGLVVLLALAAALQWAARSAWFEIRAIRFEGELVRTSAEGLRAGAAPRLAGNFFAIDLAKARAAFEAVPWVRRASVRRVWPDRLVVQVEEHRAAALWMGEERDDRLVNTHGEVFVANAADVDEEALPAFGGPDGSAAQLLAMYRRLTPHLRGLQAEIEQLHQSSRGSWRVLLDNGTTIELGRGSEDEVASRTARFVATVGEATRAYRQPLEYADLRHADGYALRLRGVTTTAPGAAARNGP